jgi:Ser/Thr protein kinase RdoA (MazF antagonist)
MAWLDQQPTDSSYFGLIHGDYCIGNLRFKGDEINVFDFDACCRHWYAYDIAIFLHYFGAGKEKARKLAYDNFLEGYAATSRFDRLMQNQIPMFGKMRLLFSYLVFAEKWGFENLEEFQERYFELRRRLFEADPTWPYI